MNADNKSEGGDDFEHVDADEEQQSEKQRQFCQDNLGYEDIKNEGSPGDSFNLAMQLKSKSNGVVENGGHFRAEIDALKTENKVLLAKVDSLQARNGELQAWLKFVELEAKLASEQMAKSVEIKVKEMEEKFQQMKSGIAEENAKLKKELQEFSREQEEKIAGKEEKLENMAKQMAEFGGKLAVLESKAIDGGNKLKEMQMLRKYLTKIIWSTNEWQWHSQKHVHVSEDGLIATKADDKSSGINLCAQQPISHGMLEFMPGLRFVYYEVKLISPTAYSWFRIHKYSWLRIGWVGSDFRQTVNWVGNHSGSYAIDSGGSLCKSGLKVGGYGYDLYWGDVIGTGLVLTPDNRLKLFFTLNGALNGEPIVVESKDLFYPAVSFSEKDASIEANFGADTAKKPFIFEINAYEKRLCG